jgi:hypothetical protein
MLTFFIDNLELTGQHLDRVYNFRSGCVYSCFCEAKQPSLKLKTRPKQLLGSLSLVGNGSIRLCKNYLALKEGNRNE